MIQLIRPDSPERWQVARRLVEEYAASLSHDLGFQDFPREIAELPNQYGPPDGAFFLAELASEIVGCVGLRKLAAGDCEMKRLYVVPACQGQGVGRALVQAIITEGRRLGYERMRLDTLPEMRAAQRLYAELGFETIPAYRHNPVEGSVFMELKLR